MSDSRETLREAVIAELYKRHPSLGARSIDEFADFVTALDRTPTPPTEIPKALRHLRGLVKQSRDGFVDGRPYVLTYSDIIADLEQIESLALAAAPQEQAGTKEG